jgi:hypothetical protein
MHATKPTHSILLDPIIPVTHQHHCRLRRRSFLGSVRFYLTFTTTAVKLADLPVVFWIGVVRIPATTNVDFI